MARRKSRKNAEAQKRPAVVKEQAAAAAPSGAGKKTPAAGASAAPAPSSPSASTAGAAPSAARAPDAGKGSHAPAAPSSGRGVRLSTCIAGMALTLVLGLYLGTLLPGVLQDMRGQGAPAPETTAAPPQQASADAAPAGAPASPPQGAETVAPAGPGLPAGAGFPPDLAARLAELQDAVRKDPASAASWTELGNLFFDAGRVHEAINAYERSLAIAPGNADVLTDLGIMYRENDAPEKAVDCFRKALAADPRHQNALFNAGVVLYTDLGRKDEAVAAWRRLLALNPQARAPDGRTVSEMVRRLEEPSGR